MSLRSFTLHDQIQRNAWLHGSRIAFVTDTQRVTHAQYAANAARMAAGPGDPGRADLGPPISDAR